MQSEFADWEDHFRELRHWIMPRRGRFSLGEKNASRRNTRIIDATGRDALRTLETGLHAGMTSPSRKWFKLGLLEREAGEAPANREWLSLSETRMYEVMRASNLYRMFPLCYRDLGLYGMHHSLLVPNFEDVVFAHSFSVGEYYLAEDEFGKVITSHRWMDMSAEKIVDRFGIENCPSMVRSDYDNNRPQAKHTVHCVIEKRNNRNPLSVLAQDMQFGVYYWVQGSATDEVLQIGGYKRNRLIAPRWDTEPGDVYSYSPAMDALGDAATLQEQHVDKATAIKKSYDPPLQGPESLRKHRAKTFPGGISYAATQDLQKGGFRPLYEVKPDISGLMADMGETRERIRGAFFSDLFQMFTTLDRRQITAEEVVRRYEEKVLMLGPVLERLSRELLQPVVDIVFADMVDAGLIPPAPEDLQGQEIKVEYVSMLHQAQQATGIQTLERTIGFVGTLGEIKPQALDMLDEDDMVREFAKQVGVAPSVIRSDEEIAQTREQRAQQMQEQALMENAQPMASAARLISEAADRGQPEGVL